VYLYLFVKYAFLFLVLTHYYSWYGPQWNFVVKSVNASFWQFRTNRNSALLSFTPPNSHLCHQQYYNSRTLRYSTSSASLYMWYIVVYTYIIPIYESMIMHFILLCKSTYLQFTYLPICRVIQQACPPLTFLNNVVIQNLIFKLLY